MYLLRAASLEQADRWAEANAEAGNAAMKLEPDNPLLLNFLGYGKLERGEDLDEAEANDPVAERARRPTMRRSPILLGWALYKRGRLPEAIATLSKAAAAGDPAQSEIHEHPGDALYTSGRRIEALLFLAGGAWSPPRTRPRPGSKRKLETRADPRHRRTLMRAFRGRPRPSFNLALHVRGTAARRAACAGDIVRLLYRRGSAGAGA